MNTEDKKIDTGEVWLKNLHRVMSGGALSPEDMAKIVRALLQVIKDHKLAVEKAMSGIRSDLEKRSGDAERSSSGKFKGLEKEVSSLATKTTQGFSALEKSIKDVKLATPPPVNLAPLQKGIEDLRRSIPKPFDSTGLTQSIEELKKELADLDEKIDQVRKIKTSSGRGGGGMNRAHFDDIDLSPQLDGVTKTFNIHAVFNILTVDLSSFPNALRKGIDFTYTATTITFTDQIDAATQLAAGQTCILTVVNA